MSAPSMPPDNSAAIESARIAAEERRRADEKAAADARKAELLGLRNTARSTGGQTARNYFSQQGINPDEYQGGIDSELDMILGGIAPDDPNPGSYFQNAGSKIYENLQTGARTKASRDLDSIFSPDFETRKIPFTMDDDYLAAIDAEQRATADSVLRNMMDRGVITSAGYNSGLNDLNTQGAGVRSRLTELGTGVLAGGQGKLKEVANRGRQTAGQLRLGQQFDPYAYGTESDQAFDEFVRTLGDQIRSRISGPLYNTAGLAAIAGAGQGAQNTAFNPNALAGITDDDDEEEDENNKENVF